MTELEFSGVGRNKEQSARLLGHLIANAPKLVKPYQEPILKVSIRVLDPLRKGQPLYKGHFQKCTCNTHSTSAKRTASLVHTRNKMTSLIVSFTQRKCINTVYNNVYQYTCTCITSNDAIIIVFVMRYICNEVLL